MEAAWNNCLKAVFPNAVHMICISHIMNILIRDFIDQFEQIIGWDSLFASFFVTSGSRKSSSLYFLKSIKASPKMLLKAVATHWTSTFNAMAYHKKILQYEKSFLDLEEDTSRVQAFLKGNYKKLILQIHFIGLRVKPLRLSMQIVESDLCIGFLLKSILDLVEIGLHSQNSFLQESVQETLDEITETFTANEKQNLLKLVEKFSVAAETKFLKHFDETSGIHPPLQFLQEICYVYQISALSLNETAPQT